MAAVQSADLVCLIVEHWRLWVMCSCNCLQWQHVDIWYTNYISILQSMYSRKLLNSLAFLLHLWRHHTTKFIWLNVWSTGWGWCFVFAAIPSCQLIWNRNKCEVIYLTEMDILCGGRVEEEDSGIWVHGWWRVWRWDW